MVVADMNGGRMQALVPRASLVPSFPAAERVGKDAHGKRILHIVATQLPDPADARRRVGVACLAAVGIHNEHLASAAHHHHSSAWSAAQAALAHGTASQPGGDLASGAADALMHTSLDPTQAHSVVQRSARPTAGAFRFDVAQRSMQTGDEQRFGARHMPFSRGTQRHQRSLSALRGASSSRVTLTAAATSYDGYVEVTIWESGYTFYIEDAQLWTWLNSYLGWDGDFTINDYTGCESASDEWFAVDAELTDFLADSTAYDDAVHVTNAFTCEHQLSNEKNCADLFIVSKHAGPLNGDGRESNPDAPYKASRMQVNYDLDGLTASFHLNGSSTWLPFLPSTPPDTAKSGAWIYAPTDSTRVLQIKAYNGYCPYVDDTSSTVCPSIDAFIRYTMRNGAWIIANPAIDVQRDAYPTLDIYRDVNGTFVPMYHSPEHWVTDLFTRHSTTEKWRQKLGLPPGCNLQ